MVEAEEESETAREETLELQNTTASQKETAREETPQLLKCKKQRIAGREQMIENSFARDTEEIMKVGGEYGEDHEGGRGAVRRRSWKCPCCTSRRRVPMCLARSCASSSSMCPFRTAGRILEHQGSMAETGQESDGDDFEVGMAEIVQSFGRCVNKQWWEMRARS